MLYKKLLKIYGRKKAKNLVKRVNCTFHNTCKKKYFSLKYFNKFLWNYHIDFLTLILSIPILLYENVTMSFWAIFEKDKIKIRTATRCIEERIVDQLEKKIIKSELRRAKNFIKN